jgi:hypothetical protein
MRLQDGTFYSALDYSLGVLSLVDQVRSAIQQPNLNPEAVVMGETTAGPVAHHWDGGLSADLGFGNVLTEERLIASPVRYGIPEVHLFGNGNNLNPTNGLKGLHQVYAAGHGLALCSNFGSNFISTNVPHIKQLVQIRKDYGDALIHGQQINQPPSDNDCVVAYQYLGSEHRMITIVNLTETQMTTNITIPAPDPGGEWMDLLTSDRFTTQAGVLHRVVMQNGAGGIRVLRWFHSLKR